MKNRQKDIFRIEGAIQEPQQYTKGFMDHSLKKIESLVLR